MGVDDYPVTNEMFRVSKTNSNNYTAQSGNTISNDKVWFCNDTLNQILVFELYTDYYILATYHFYKNDIPMDLLKSIELLTERREIADEKQKLKDINGFLMQAKRISKTFFITKKGIELGNTKQEAIKIYGETTKKSTVELTEKLEWEFVGDSMPNHQETLKGKALAKNSWGHKIQMYFKDGKLIGQVLMND